MASYKAPDFNERTAAARLAKDKALAKLRERPAVDPAQAAERQAARLAKEAAAQERARARRAEQEAQKAAKRDAAAAAAPVVKPKLSEDEARAARDAKYAARKSRKK
ncbi:MAG TPA: DUF6481 family protein [Novosphingobium sp.]|nr:DUF6481 family protein [Novosphingobium sp.]